MIPQSMRNSIDICTKIDPLEHYSCLKIKKLKVLFLRNKKMEKDEKSGGVIMAKDILSKEFGLL